MILFQWGALLVIAAILLLEVVQAWRQRRLTWVTLTRLAIWSAAAVGISFPEMVTRFANSIGVGRGADALIYLVTLAFIATTFYFYSRYLRLQRQLTDLARYLTIQEAKRPGAASSGNVTPES
ncbi:DUF2304 domain-containing protein [Bremerella cremea]|uniref:DUF2304 domain-containing protein n=1 Tax=Bremerella cremea TaxID=1031537 RepID=UPI0031EF3F54